jgi:polyisoprenoid-binding protein YceI
MSGSQIYNLFTLVPRGCAVPKVISDYAQTASWFEAQLLNSMQKSILLIAMCTALVSAQDKAIDVQRSTITVHVGKAGVFSVAGHDHWINAPISAGALNDSDRPRVEFRVDASKMAVKPDPKVDDKTQAEIQRDMQERTIESATYPEISFRSSRVEKQPDGQWKVDGTLTLHGVTKPIAAVVKRSGDAYVGHATLRQSDFGIKPISAAGGTVKVKNELEIDFHIVTATR